MSGSPNKDRSRIRIERDHEYHIEDDSSQSWAISYADFLMVLLSFFILFFSVDKSKRQSIIEAIVSATNEHSTSRGPQAVNSGATGGSQEPSLAGLARTVKDLKMQVVDQQESLVLFFPNNIYHPGQISLDSENTKRLRKVLEAMAPYMKDIEITFIGHTDSQPLEHKRENVDNNFDLSALRASKALDFALKMGLSPDHLAAKGSAQTQRNSRTLSLLVRPYEPVMQ